MILSNTCSREDHRQHYEEKEEKEDIFIFIFYHSVQYDGVGMKSRMTFTRVKPKIMCVLETAAVRMLLDICVGLPNYNYYCDFLNFKTYVDY